MELIEAAHEHCLKEYQAPKEAQRSHTNERSRRRNDEQFQRKISVPQSVIRRLQVQVEADEVQEAEAAAGRQSLPLLNSQVVKEVQKQDGGPKA